MKIKQFTIALSFMSFASLLMADDEVQFKAYGKAITVMNIEKLGLSEKEKVAFLEGVKAALKESKLNEEDQKGLAKLGRFLDERAAKPKSCESGAASCKSCPD